MFRTLVQATFVLVTFVHIIKLISSTTFCHTRLHLGFSAKLASSSLQDGATTRHYCHETTHPPPATHPQPIFFEHISVESVLGVS